MQEIIQTSPVAHAQAHGSAKWEVINGMNTAIEYASAEIEAIRKRVLGVADVSCLVRYGVKGPNAAQWLQNHHIAIPAQANEWVVCDLKTLVLRLGNSEFLIEDQLGGYACERLASDKARVENVYPVARADASFIVSGSASLDLFSEVCSLDLREKSLGANQLIMTQIASISATIIRHTLNAEPVYRIWCDGTYGAYLWKVLVDIATELDGGAVGLGLYLSQE
jgi:sarcosine oxidase, subunit gamma